LFPDRGIVLAARAVTSVYATLGVAAATLVVVGAILVGPSILECARDAGGLGACLRGKAAENGLISPDISSDQPAPAGWMEAVANEYEAPASAPVELEGARADLLAEAAEISSAEAIEVAVAPAAELATVAPAQEEPAVSVALVGPEGEISARIAVVDAGSGGAADLSQPTDGTLTAETPSEAAVDVAVAIQPIDPADELTSAVEPPPSEPAPVELSAEPVPSEPEPSQPEPSLEPEPPQPGPSSEATPEPSSEPEPEEPAIVVEFNPQFPNVIVLPPPTAGDDSSFRSLQLN
jgi:hypothetical protein